MVFKPSSTQLKLKLNIFLHYNIKLATQLYLVYGLEPRAVKHHTDKKKAEFFFKYLGFRAMR